MSDFERPDAEDILKSLRQKANEIPIMDYDADYFQKLSTIRQYYSNCINSIIDFNTLNPHTPYDVYPFDWGRILTESEKSVFDIFRIQGRIVMYPKFPIAGFFIDFANPVKKIAIEIGGKKFHDKEKDSLKRTAFKNLGYTAIRIDATKVFRLDYTDWQHWGDGSEDEDVTWEKIKDWIMNTGDGIIQAVKIIYFDGHIYAPEEYQYRFRVLCEQAIENNIF